MLILQITPQRKNLKVNHVESFKHTMPRRNGKMLGNNTIGGMVKFMTGWILWTI